LSLCLEHAEKLIKIKYTDRRDSYEKRFEFDASGRDTLYKADTKPISTGRV
jgi:hypothetical protein